MTIPSLLYRENLDWNDSLYLWLNKDHDVSTWKFHTAKNSVKLTEKCSLEKAVKTIFLKNSVFKCKYLTIKKQVCFCILFFFRKDSFFGPFYSFFWGWGGGYALIFSYPWKFIKTFFNVLNLSVVQLHHTLSYLRKL